MTEAQKETESKKNMLAVEHGTKEAIHILNMERQSLFVAVARVKLDRKPKEIVTTVNQPEEAK